MATRIRGGNFVSEWFGQRIYPRVRLNISAVSGPSVGQCPFLGDVLQVRTPCVKNTNSAGVCTVSSVSNGPRQGFSVSRYGILEIQTMDYHGSYKNAVNNLRDGLRLHGETFPTALEANLDRWAGEGMEGPNVANVFKRTFYQMMLKFRMAGEGSAAAGTILALPRSVWDSWQPFLGAPELEEESPGIMRLRTIPGATSEPPLNAFICVFDLDDNDAASISPVRIEHFVRMSPERLTHHAFTVVPAHILQSIQTDESVLARIRARLGVWWPTFQSRPAPRRR